jgi:hypothetical protein
MTERKKNFNVGDLVQLVEREPEYSFIFRPLGFPFGKVGLITEISAAYRHPDGNPLDAYSEETHGYSRIAYDYDFRWYYDELIAVLVEGRTYWVFTEEIEKYSDEGT